MKLIVRQTDEDVQNYKIGQEMVRFTCDSCHGNKMIKLCDMEPDMVLCRECKVRMPR